MFCARVFSVLAGLGLLCEPAIAATLQITTSSVPAATQYQPYSTTLTATGGTPPYSWSVIASTGVSLPEGMTLNASTGLVSATLVAGQGGYEVTIQVTDSASPSHAVATAALDFGVYSDTSLGGCQIFPVDSIYNQRVDQLPVDTTPSHQIPSGYANNQLHPDFGHGFYPFPGGIPWMRVPANQAITNVNLPGSGQIDAAGTYSWPFPAWPNAVMEGTAYGTEGNDHHTLILQSSVNSINGPQTGPCTLYETYSSAATAGIFNASSNTWYEDAGIHYVLNSNELAASPDSLDDGAQDSAGVPVMPLLLRYSEVPAQATHPLRITFPGPTDWFVWPATGCCTGSGIPQGLLYRLKAGVNWQATCPVASYPQAATVLQALQQYGAYMSDHGSAGYMEATPDIRWDDDDLACIKRFHVSDLEVVDNSVLEISATSGQTKPYVPPASLNAGAAGSPYTNTFAAVGGNPATRTWSVSSGALPPGLVLNATSGAISGLINSSASGSYTFGMTATDTSSSYSSNGQSFSIAVTPFTVRIQDPPAPVAVLVSTVPVGLPVKIDGTTYQTPQKLSWVPGSSHTVSAVSSQGGSTRYVFANWSDGGADSHSIVAPSAPATYLASFTTQYLLTAKASPAAAGSTIVTPPSRDGYYNAGSTVQVAALPAVGQKFSTFTGDLTGSANPQSLKITGARSVTADFVPLPRLTIGLRPTLSFLRGQRSARYEIAVSAEFVMAGEEIVVHEMAPAGMSVVSMAGAGWSCASGGHTCSRHDARESYPPIVVTVNIDAHAERQLLNMTSVSGGGAPTASAMQVLDIR
jgi:hypothetical protein